MAAPGPVSAAEVQPPLDIADPRLLPVAGAPGSKWSVADYAKKVVEDTKKAADYEHQGNATGRTFKRGVAAVASGAGAVFNSPLVNPMAIPRAIGKGVAGYSADVVKGMTRVPEAEPAPYEPTQAPVPGDVGGAGTAAIGDQRQQAADAMPAPGGAPPGEQGPQFANVAAHEVDLYGPSQHAALNNANQATSETIGRVGERNAYNAQDEQVMYAEQARRALDQQQVMNASLAQRQQEFEQRSQEFDSAVKEAAQAGKIDPGRFWASRSTGQQIAGLIGVALGGFVHGSTGRENTALAQINHAVDRDVQAQMFDYQAKQNTAQAKQTAYSMAFQKYQNVDAARSMATAAGLQAAHAQIAQMAAKWKGTEAANRADEAGAALQQDIAKQVLAGTQFVQAHQVQTGGPMQLTQQQQFQLALKQAEMDADERKDVRHTAQKREEDDQQGQKFIAEKEQTAGIPELEQASKDLRDATPATGDIPGYGPIANRIHGLPGVGTVIHKGIYGKDAAVTQQRLAGAKNTLYHKLSGAAVGPKEEVRLQANLDAANDAESLREFEGELDRSIAASKANIRSGVSKGSAGAYDKRHAQETKPSVPKSFK